MEIKTNAMRFLDQHKVPYKPVFYQDALSGTEVASALNEDENRVFKTLVLVGKSKQHYVFMIPVAAELNLKKAALVAKEKSVEMIKQKELLPLTGYVHGGCSPLGMKKRFPTFIHETATTFESVFFSGGKIGAQINCSFADLNKVFPIQTADLI